MYVRRAAWLALALGVAAAATAPSRPSFLASDSNAQSEASADLEVHDLIRGLRSLRRDVEREASDPSAPVRHLHQRLLRHLTDDIDEVLPDELHKLQVAFDGMEGGGGAADPATNAPVKKEKHWLLRRAVEKLKKHQNGAARHPRKADSEQCGAHIKASKLGLRRGLATAKHFGKAFLQGPEGEEEAEDYVMSAAGPGSGAAQKVKSEGKSEMGTSKGLEPFVSVFKDGFWSVGCFMDKAFRDYDAFGDNKDRYHKDAKFTNVSIASYKELVLKEKAEKMTPRVCFEFCRTIEHMVFFGINNGDQCYCAPYYITGTGGEGDDCGLPCPGDGNQNCGGKQKSSIYEMHYCGGRGAALAGQATSGGEALSAFYAAALYSKELATQLQASGALLQEVAGLGGDPESAELAQEAKKFAGEVEGAVLDGECVDNYNMLLTTYEESEATSLLDMKKAENLQKADDELMVMEKLMPLVQACAEKASDLITLGYPAYRDSVEAKDDASLLAAEEKYGTSMALFFPLMYVIKNKKAPKPSTCNGKLVGKPMIGTIAQCAQACYDHDKCEAYQFIHLGGGESGHGGDEDPMMPLCFMFKEIKGVTVYDCDITNSIAGGALLETNVSSGHASLRGMVSAEEPAEDEESSVDQLEAQNCEQVKQAMLYSAMTCKELFGSKSSILDTCKDECEGSKGALFGSVCMSNFATIQGATPNVELVEKERCFAGARNKEVTDSGGAAINMLPYDEQGVVLSGDATLKGTVVFEPIIWSVAEE